MAASKCNAWSSVKIVFAVVYVGLWMFAVFNYRSNCVITWPESLLVTTDADRDGKCGVNVDELGVVKLDMLYDPTFEEIIKENPQVKPGGSWKPDGCQAWQKVAIVIPYRDRALHLAKLLRRLHPMLRKQKLDYQIFVVEQMGKGTFNRGKLKNIGYLEAMKAGKFDCVIQHDVDLIPEHDGNLYMCDDNARHLAHAIDEMRYHVLYYNIAGGVIALNTKNFRLANGYSNKYWGWGAEDDDLSARAQETGLKISRPPMHIGRFKMIRHKKERIVGAIDRMQNWRYRWRRDGLNDTIGMNYTVMDYKYHKLFTHVLVDVGFPPKDLQGVFDEGPRVGLMWNIKFYIP